jgi:uncharacterized protein DUF6815
MNRVDESNGLKVALLWRGDPERFETPTPQNNRLYPLFRAFADLNVTAEPVPYSDQAADHLRARLLQVDGVLVWVDPVTEQGDRSKLDPMLTEVGARGVWVSAHPDVIQKIGTKEVLFRTGDFGWGTDTHLYATQLQFRTEFPTHLRAIGRCVVKQRRGNGGIGTWKIEIARNGSDPVVRVREARRGGTEEELRLSDFMHRCEKYFSNSGCIIDQPFQPRIGEGMVRCYLVHDKVAGFSTQMPRAQGDFAMAREKTMSAEQEPCFARLRAKMEFDWIPRLQRLFRIDATSLPAIWDADFMYGLKDADGQDSYVLSEINVSAVFPFPDAAIDKIVLAASRRLADARRRRRD